MVENVVWYLQVWWVLGRYGFWLSTG